MNLLNLLRSTVLCSLFLLSLHSFAQSFPVTGKATDANGQPLAGVTIQVKGGTTKTVSAADGSFSINAPSPTSTLVLSYVGFTEQEIAINNRGQLNVSLQNTATSLEDVVVVGYGTVKKKDVTGAVAGISQKDI